MSDLTLLSGVNGMGKSSVLQAILLLRQSYLDGLLPGTGLELNGSLVRLGTAQDVFFADAEGNDFEIGVTWREGPHARFVLEYHRDADVLKINSESIDQDAFARTPFTDAFHYLQAERLGPRTTNAVSEFQVREHRQMGTAGEFAEHFLDVYGAENISAKSLLHAGSKFSDLRSQVQAWLHEISPGTEIHLTMHPEMDIVNLRYSFVTGDQRSNRFRSTSVGFGITYALPILVALLSSKPGSILLLENPEAHLHPRGQVKIGELLAKAAAAGVQVIVETHSDHVLNGVRIAVHAGVIAPESISICYFSRMEDAGRVRSSVESPSIDKDGRLDKWPDGFFDEWDRSLECLLEPRSEKA
jgi:predicted ATPase